MFFIWRTKMTFPFDNGHFVLINNDNCSLEMRLWQSGWVLLMHYSLFFSCGLIASHPTSQQLQLQELSQTKKLANVHTNCSTYQRQHLKIQSWPKCLSRWFLSQTTWMMSSTEHLTNDTSLWWYFHTNSQRFADHMTITVTYPLS